MTNLFMRMPSLLTCSKRASQLTKIENTCGGVRKEGDKGKAEKEKEEEVGSHASLLALFSLSEVFP